mmetsp:Transcript_24395/g.75312  ORF Transcript_24395/g.75312 Transcript_24395/m.75312 type:complete len:136 (+) Transcript_24395:326-733(+)
MTAPSPNTSPPWTTALSASCRFLRSNNSRNNRTSGSSSISRTKPTTRRKTARPSPLHASPTNKSNTDLTPGHRLLRIRHSGHTAYKSRIAHAPPPFVAEALFYSPLFRLSSPLSPSSYFLVSCLVVSLWFYYHSS